MVIIWRRLYLQNGFITFNTKWRILNHKSKSYIKITNSNEQPDI